MLGLRSHWAWCTSSPPVLDCLVPTPPWPGPPPSALPSRCPAAARPPPWQGIRLDRRSTPIILPGCGKTCPAWASRDWWWPKGATRLKSWESSFFLWKSGVTARQRIESPKNSQLKTCTLTFKKLLILWKLMTIWLFFPVDGCTSMQLLHQHVEGPWATVDGKTLPAYCHLAAPSVLPLLPHHLSAYLWNLVVHNLLILMVPNNMRQVHEIKYEYNQ